jgi:hypothetical protein
MNTDLIQSFIGKTVQVKIAGYTVYGRLCSFLDSYECKSCILLLLTKNSFTLIKGNFESLGETSYV